MNLLLPKIFCEPELFACTDLHGGFLFPRNAKGLIKYCLQQSIAHRWGYDPQQLQESGDDPCF